MKEIEQVINRNLEGSRQVTQSILSIGADIEKAAELVYQTLKNGHKLISCGNGGSACDATHFATEFVSRYLQERRPYPAISLSAGGDLMTALINDYDPIDVFSRQLRGYAQPGDLFVCFTTSGKSKNIYQALMAAKALGISSVAFLGKGGGTCRGLASVDLLVPSQETPRVQEAHQLLFHIICESVEKRLCASI